MAHEIGPFFGEPKYLTVSSQLHLEALAQSVGNVWTLSPTFRAEKSDTARHLSEFYMLEAEVAFTNDLNAVMDVVEDLLRYLTRRLMASQTGSELLETAAHKNDIPEDAQITSNTGLKARWESLCQDSWPRITFYEACEKLKEAHVDPRTDDFHMVPDETSGLQTEHERYLADVLYKGPVFVTDYPKSIKPFYMAPSSPSASGQSPVSTVACFDLLLPEVCEVAGGSQREHRLEPLMSRMRKQGLISATEVDASSPLDWYLDLRRYGSMPHGGFGLGFDRLLGFLAGVKNIRDVVTFPRYYKHCLS